MIWCNRKKVIETKANLNGKISYEKLSTFFGDCSFWDYINNVFLMRTSPTRTRYSIIYLFMHMTLGKRYYSKLVS